MFEKEQAIHALSKNNTGLVKRIITDVDITNIDTGQKIQTQGIWDTGATISVITKSIANALELIPVRTETLRGVHGIKEVNVYYVNITLNNKNITLDTKVAECDKLSPDDSVGALIGMNIITMGDFAITNYQGDTTMSFRVPSLQKIDFEGTELNKNNVTKLDKKII
jgi:hypothetical protein